MSGLSKELLKIATLGTAHHGIDLSVLGEEEQSERAFLRMVATNKLSERAGWIPMVDKNPLPETCPIDNRPICSWEAVMMLVKATENRDFNPLIKKWFQALHEQGWLAPYEAMPFVFSLLQNWKVSSQYIRPVLSERARWLAQVSDIYQWAWVVPEIILNISPKHFPFNVLWLCIRTIHQTDPDAAREYLQHYWAEIDKKHIFAFYVNPNSDAPLFIEQVFESEVGKPIEFRAFFEYIRRFPTSQFAQTYFEAIRSNVKVSLSNDGNFEVHIPTEIDPILKCYGVEAVDMSIDNIFRTTPPYIWSEQLGISITELVDLLIEQHNKQIWGDWQKQ